MSKGVANFCIRLDDVTINEGGHAVASGAALREGVRIFRFVIEDAIILDDGGREHFFQFGAGVRTVGAELVQERDVFAWDMGKMFEQPGNEALVGRCASNVGE